MEYLTTTNTVPLHSSATSGNDGVNNDTLFLYGSDKLTRYIHLIQQIISGVSQ